MRRTLQRMLHFVRRDIWRFRARDLPRSRFMLIRFLRTIVLAVRGFHVDHCNLRASALTLYSLLAVVPAAAMAFGIAKGFGLDERLAERIRTALQGQPDVAEWIIQFAHTALQNAKGGLIAGFGVVILLWTVIKLLGNIERSFNHIWSVRQARPFLRKFSDYFSIVIICPILLVASGAIPVLIERSVERLVDKLTVLGWAAPAAFAAIGLLPHIFGIFTFAFLYTFMPNTKVKLRSALVAGAAGYLAYEALTEVYLALQVGVSKYSAIYGSFAALPLFVIWLQLGWLVVLFGAELSFADQNVDTYEFEPDCLEASTSLRRLITLRIVQLLAVRFRDGQAPMSGSEVSHELGVPIRLVNEVLFELVQAGVLSEVRLESDTERVFQPARSVETLTPVFVMEALAAVGSSDVPIHASPDLERLSGAVGELWGSLEHAPSNKPLADI
jgi:membrane protein